MLKCRSHLRHLIWFLYLPSFGYGCDGNPPLQPESTDTDAETSTDSSSSQQAITPCPIETLSPVSQDPVCNSYCASNCGPKVPNCIDRCNLHLDLSKKIGEEAGTGDACLQAAVEFYRCSGEQGCDDPETEITCLNEYKEVDRQCMSSPVFPGQGVCHEQCDSIACSCQHLPKNPYTDWDDCYYQCLANLNFDLAEGCFPEGVAIRKCVTTLETCSEYESLLQKENEEKCVQESLAWENKCAGDG